MAKFTRSKKIAVVTTALVVGVSGTAFAYWTQLGAGTGTAGTGTTVAVVVNQTTVVAGLYPGGPAVPLTGNFNNPNAAAVSVGAVTATVTGTGDVLCLPAWYSITGTGTPTTQVIPAGTAQGNWAGLNVSMLNNAANQDICKNKSITITYAVAAAS